jgi:TetR/AcrR family transcriptional regulator
MNDALPTPPANAHAATAAMARKPSAARLRKIDMILSSAERHFALLGFEGAPLEQIAQDAGFSRHNLLYYYPSKEALYQAVLASVIDDWLGHMTGLSKDGDPAQQIRQYICEKFEFARTRPYGSQLFTKEMIAGAPFAASAVRERIAPLLAANVAAFAHWAEQGLIAPVNFQHLMFSIWAITQGYVDQQTQFALLQDKAALDAGDFAQAEALLVQMLSATLKIELPD